MKELYHNQRRVIYASTVILAQSLIWFSFYLFFYVRIKAETAISEHKL